MSEHDDEILKLLLAIHATLQRQEKHLERLAGIEDRMAERQRDNRELSRQMQDSLRRKPRSK